MRNFKHTAANVRVRCLLCISWSNWIEKITENLNFIVRIKFNKISALIKWSYLIVKEVFASNINFCGIKIYFIHATIIFFLFCWLFNECVNYYYIYIHTCIFLWWLIELLYMLYYGLFLSNSSSIFWYKRFKSFDISKSLLHRILHKDDDDTIKQEHERGNDRSCFMFISFLCNFSFQ